MPVIKGSNIKSFHTLGTQYDQGNLGVTLKEKKGLDLGSPCKIRINTSELLKIAEYLTFDTYRKRKGGLLYLRITDLSLSGERTTFES